MATLGKVIVPSILVLLSVIWQAEGQCRSVQVVSREEWQASRPTSEQYLRTPLSKVFIHHTAGNRCYSYSRCASTVRSIQRYHMRNRGWSDIGYNFLIGDDGRAYEGRGWRRVGAQARGYNTVSYGIVFMGNFMNQRPSHAALRAAQNLIACGIEKGYISAGYQLYGHRDGGRTLCPGNQLYALIQSWPHYSHRHP